MIIKKDSEFHEHFLVKIFRKARLSDDRHRDLLDESGKCARVGEFLQIDLEKMRGERALTSSDKHWPDSPYYDPDVVRVVAVDSDWEPPPPEIVWEDLEKIEIIRRDYVPGSITPAQMREFASSHEIKVAFTDNPNRRNRGCYTSEVLLGEFEDEELRTIAFFHELGHVLQKRPPFEEWEYQHYSETLAWHKGVALAAELGLRFSPGALKWARGQLSTYFRDNHPEKSPMKFLPQAIQEAGISGE